MLSSARRQNYQAIAALNRTIDLDPKYPDATPSVRRMPHRAVDAEAVAAYTKTIALGLDTPTTQIYLGAASAHAGDRTRALAILQQLQSSKAHASAAELAMAADGAWRAGAGICLARAGISRARYSAAVPWRRAGTRSATLGPTLCGPGATCRSAAMIGRFATHALRLRAKSYSRETYSVRIGRQTRWCIPDTEQSFEPSGMLTLCCVTASDAAQGGKAASASRDGGFLKLPIVDKQDIRFTSVSTNNVRLQTFTWSIVQDHMIFCGLALSTVCSGMTGTT